MRNLKYLLVALALTCVSSSAIASLQVFPTRLVLSQQQRITQISLRHLGQKAETYKISAVFFRMSPDGSLKQVSTPEAKERALSSMIRFSPREVQLNPNQEQTVRVMFVNNQPLDDGEYRAHLHFEPSSEPDPVADKATGRQVAMQLTAKIAIAVPVFYRQGKTELKVELSKLKYFQTPDQKNAVSFDLSYQGNRFLYGDFHTYFVKPDGTKTEIGLINGFSSYIEKRPATLMLDSEKSKNLSGGKIRVELVEQASDGGNLLASAEQTI